QAASVFSGAVSPSHEIGPASVPPSIPEGPESVGRLELRQPASEARIRTEAAETTAKRMKSISFGDATTPARRRPWDSRTHRGTQANRKLQPGGKRARTLTHRPAGLRDRPAPRRARCRGAPRG